MAEKRVRVAIIARVGLSQNILPPGVQFSHTGFAVYSKIKTKDGRLLPGYAIFNLYQGDQRTGRSYLTQDYPVDYLAVAQQLKVGIILPNRKLQRRLLETIFSQTYTALHNPRYSVLSNPFTAQFQNCTEFVLDVLFAAIYRTNDLRRLKINIAAYFQPQPININRLKLNWASATMPDVTTEDHTEAIVVSTFSSIARFLLNNGMAKEAFNFNVDPNTLYGSKDKLAL